MKLNRELHFKTREVHAGVEPDPVTGAILTPIYQSTTYVQESVDERLQSIIDETAKKQVARSGRSATSWL